jgi:NAD(P)-dependent dehydrogenase (short-subunit alcohol dehydrogenase family)
MTTKPNWLDGRRALVAGPGGAADRVAAALAETGAMVVRLPSPSVDAGEIGQSFAEAAEQGEIDILVHAGAAIGDAAPETVTLDAWRATVSADIDGRFLHMAEFARRRIAAKARGAILLLMPSPALAPGRAGVLSAHGALDNLVKSVAVEWGRDGIRTNAIASRVVDGFDAAPPTARGSLGHLAAYLVSDYAAYVTGMVMGIDEG